MEKGFVEVVFEELKMRWLDAAAAIEHKRWARWQRYVHSKCQRTECGELIIPSVLVQQWTRQIETDYEDLTEKEKESDREQVRSYYPLIKKIIKSVSARPSKAA